MSTDPAFASTTSGALSSASTDVLAFAFAGLIPLPTPSLGYLVNVKLTHDNYLSWKAQLLPYLRGQQLLGYIDGTNQCHPKIIARSTEAGYVQVPNLSYAIWIQQDQIV